MMAETAQAFGFSNGRATSRVGGFGTRTMLVVGTAVIWFLLVALCPIHSALEMGADEHFELNKAVLIQEGYQPHIDFWNDQPPLISRGSLSCLKSRNGRLFILER